MATQLMYNGGPKTWSASVSEEGHREYRITFRVRGVSADGPAVAMQTPGLPLPGSYWVYGNDIDLYAYRKLNVSITPVVESGEPNTFWDLEFFYTTKPMPRCQDAQVEDPLLEPVKVSGSFTKYTEEATHDRFGRFLTNSAWEQLRGPTIEFDDSRPTVRIEVNVLNLNLAVFAPMVDTVNSTTLWGLPPRCIKLSNVSWERKYYGQCNVYYNISFEFDINAKTFDRYILDEGTKCLNGDWGHIATGDEDSGWVITTLEDGTEPNPFNPQHYIAFTDRKGEKCHVILNGAGLPADVIVGLAGPFYVSMQTPNINNATTNTASWREVTAGLPPNLFNIDATYGIGAIVYVPDIATLGTADVYITTDNTTGGWHPGEGVGFIHLGRVMESAAGPTQLGYNFSTLIRDMGIWSPAVEYQKGMLVTPLAALTGRGPGSLFISKYTESNFLLLGVPTVL